MAESTTIPMPDKIIKVAKIREALASLEQQHNNLMADLHACEGAMQICHKIIEYSIDGETDGEIPVSK